MAKKEQLLVEGKNVPVSNLDKIFYPKANFSKGDVIDFYVRIAPVLLPHLKSRAITLKRYPDGVEGSFFYEKQCPSHAPKWIKTTKVDKNNGDIINYCVINDLPSLVWAANIANLEVHTFMHKGTSINKPTGVVFDLDPGPPADIVDCCQVGLWIKAIFENLGLECFAKTSGSKGLQLIVPLNGPVTYEKTKNFAKIMADTLAHRFPDKVVSDMKKSLRTGKVFIDWSQNDDKKTTACVYSLRAKEYPTVSTPVTWDEVTKTLKRRNAKSLTFTSKDVLKRVEKFGDLFEPVLTLKQKLPNVSALEE